MSRRYGLALPFALLITGVVLAVGLGVYLLVAAVAT